MRLPERGFHNGAKRSADLLEKGLVMNLGDDTTAVATAPSWSAGLLDFAKSAAGLINQQRTFNQQLSVARQTGTAVQPYAQTVQVAPAMNWGRIAMLGAAGVLAIILLKRVMR